MVDESGTRVWPSDADRVLAIWSELVAGVEDAKIQVSPSISSAVIDDSVARFFDPAPGETILGAAATATSAQTIVDLVFTCRGIHYVHKSITGGPAGLSGRRFPGFTDYANLPAQLNVSGWSVPAIDLGDGRRLRFASGKPTARAVASILTRARAVARGEAEPRPADPSALALLPAVIELGRRVEAYAHDVRGFHAALPKPVRPLLTYAIIAACVVVFAVMTARGVSPMEPRIADLVDWGANFGPAIIVDHEYHRLFTATFLHIGLIHLIMNMGALAAAGPAVERIFGRLGFAVIYFVSGFVGSVVSVSIHPLLVSAGASGAIFGVFGAVLGLLTARKSEVPSHLFQRKLKEMGTFLAMNLVIGLSMPQIDLAAHIGGFAAGAACGFVLAWATKPRAAASKGDGSSADDPSRKPAEAPRRRSNLGVRLLASAAIVAVAAGGGAFALSAVRPGLEALPEVRSLRAEPAWNDFITAAQPLIAGFDELQKQIDEAGRDGRLSAVELRGLVERVPRSEELVGRLGRVALSDPELEPIRQALVDAFTHQNSAYRALARFAKSGEVADLTGPEGSARSLASITADLQRFRDLTDAYFRANGLTRDAAAAEAPGRPVNAGDLGKRGS
ncbi:MAG: rhomboid family intramembrane serine protease [Isosphaeraceae bacterium]|nr:rhomboid family intramembrane serine protease [Isosphaeraceae bacterium]